MDQRLEIFEQWAPYGARWTEWAKPVLFSTLPVKSFAQIDIPKIKWIDQIDYRSMIIVDTEGMESVREGLAYAKLGYRPVPLYNGVRGEIDHNLIDVDQLQVKLFAGAKVLQECEIAKDAPPVFLLDSRRMEVNRKRGVFDNRWTLFPQDMPSGTFLKQHGITRIYVRSDKIRNDLAHILYRYQKEGIAIYLCEDKKEQPTLTKVKKPSRLKSLSYRFLVMLKLRRNATGGFGAYVPDQSGSGYYGVG